MVEYVTRVRNYDKNSCLSIDLDYGLRTVVRTREYTNFLFIMQGIFLHIESLTCIIDDNATDRLGLAMHDRLLCSIIHCLACCLTGYYVCRLDF